MIQLVSVLLSLVGNPAQADIAPGPGIIPMSYQTPNNCFFVSQPVVVMAEACGNGTSGICFGTVMCNGTTETQVSCAAVGQYRNQCQAPLDCLNDQTVNFVSNSPQPEIYYNNAKRSRS